MASAVTPEVEVFKDHAAASEAAAKAIIEAKPKTMALSGGSTPAEVYRRLSGSSFDFDGVHVFLTDERMLPLDHVASNYRLVYEHLADRDGVHLHPVDTSGSPQDAAASYSSQLGGSWPLDLVLLGMGSDGHVASLFPGATVSGSDDLVVPTWSKATGTWRISMSYRAIDGCRQVLILATGEKKKDALTRMLRGDDIPAAKIAPKGRFTVITDVAASGG